TFLNVWEQTSRTIVTVADPPLKDFMISWLGENISEVHQVLRNSVFFEQGEIAWELSRQHSRPFADSPPPVPVDLSLLATGLGRTRAGQPLPDTSGLFEVAGPWDEGDRAWARCSRLLDMAVDSGSLDLYREFEASYSDVSEAEADKG